MLLILTILDKNAVAAYVLQVVVYLCILLVPCSFGNAICLTRLVVPRELQIRLKDPPSNSLDTERVWVEFSYWVLDLVV